MFRDGDDWQLRRFLEVAESVLSEVGPERLAQAIDDLRIRAKSMGKEPDAMFVAGFLTGAMYERRKKTMSAPVQVGACEVRMYGPGKGG